MVDSDTAPTRPRGGLMNKRHAILAGALTVFARDGYTRASIDAISVAAGVSTRTIYNHFQDKAELFQTVIQESAARVAEAQILLIEQHLGDLTDAAELEAALVAFGTAWVSPMADYAAHSALVRQINAEAEHIPAAAIATWQRTGPLRVRRELGYHLRQLADRGLLRIDDPTRAALHLGALISAGGLPAHGDIATPEGNSAAVATTVAAGVHAFLHGHLPR